MSNEDILKIQATRDDIKLAPAYLNKIEANTTSLGPLSNDFGDSSSTAYSIESSWQLDSGAKRLYSTHEPYTDNPRVSRSQKNSYRFECPPGTRIDEEFLGKGSRGPFGYNAGVKDVFPLIKRSSTSLRRSQKPQKLLIEKKGDESDEAEVLEGPDPQTGRRDVTSEKSHQESVIRQLQDVLRKPYEIVKTTAIEPDKWHFREAGRPEASDEPSSAVEIALEQDLPIPNTTVDSDTLSHEALVHHQSSPMHPALSFRRDDVLDEPLNFALVVYHAR
ncbi:MAG: hypothetical protein M1833_002171 [Piccolia ochrophora]|nr:MAG: hypothetical protein M1833_002171 [Piccolia ochrophora]